MTDRLNDTLPSAHATTSAASETAQAIDVPPAPLLQNVAVEKADRMLRNGLLCMVGAVVLLIVVAVCTLSDNSPTDQKNLSAVKQLFSDSTAGTTQTVAASVQRGFRDVSPMMGLRNNLTQLSSMMNSLRQVRDRIPQALAAALPPV